MRKFNADCWLHLLSNRKRYFAVAIVNFALIISCFAGIYKPSKGDETPAASFEELKSGRNLYINNCASCHALHQPERYDTAQWRQWMDKMAVKAKINLQDKALIMKYVTKGAK
ncbi:MAG: hypothetical protein ACOYOT_00520 [Bacteroidales bacterium]